MYLLPVFMPIQERYYQTHEQHPHWVAHPEFRCTFCVQCLLIGRSRGCCQCAPPPTGSISFIFTYVFTEKCTCQRLAPPNRSVPPQQKILDLPLQCSTGMDFSSILNLASTTRISKLDFTCVGSWAVALYSALKRRGIIMKNTCVITSKRM